MKMLEPDFWRGRGRFSQKACARKIKDEDSYRPREQVAEVPEEK